ncbi:conserved hypothetical protein [Vibrio phage 501E54-1]|nr:conserved hypothetical protein [Vibrio phage 501E54-1]
MFNVMQDGTIEQLETLRTMIRNDQDYSEDTKEVLIECLSDRIRTLTLQKLMQPIVEEFIKERKEEEL